MTYNQYKKAFEKEAYNSGYPEKYVNQCLEYARVLLNNKVPVIYDTSHLAALVGYKKEYIKRAVVYTPYFYRDFKILKKNGKYRQISEPLPNLKDIQIWILDNILSNVKVSGFAKAYRKRVSIIENLKYHQRQSKVLTIDLEDFFPSIKVKSVESVFKNLGYSKLLSNLFAKLCTRDNSLPQGAPTSPYLSNIYFKPADRLIATYCIANDIKYTRYADDLTFSGDFDEDKLLGLVEDVVKDLNLRINKKKTKLMTPNMRQTVTGVVVNQKPQVVFHKRNKLRQEIYFIRKFGLENHINNKHIKQSNYLNHIIGQVNFVLQINPEDREFQEYRAFLFELKVPPHQE